MLILSVFTELSNISGVEVVFDFVRIDHCYLMFRVLKRFSRPSIHLEKLFGLLA